MLHRVHLTLAMLEVPSHINGIQIQDLGFVRILSDLSSPVQIRKQKKDLVGIYDKQI